MPKAPSTRPKATARAKDPKASHLYTDDNPSTTLQGTGFRDAAAAKKTIQLVSNRSLTYQFQTINTMNYRALHHPKRTAAMDDAMKVFKIWLEETYPAAKAGLREKGFKPALKRETVEKLLPAMEKAGVDTTFAQRYVKMPKGKRLANLLWEDDRPDGDDWDSKRYKALEKLWPESADVEVVDKDGAVTRTGLELAAWAWCPVYEGKMVKGNVEK